MPSKKEETIISQSPFSRIVNTTSSIGSRYANPIIERIPENSLITKEKFENISQQFLENSLKIAEFLDKNYETLINWAHHNFMHIPYENIMGYLQGLKRFKNCKENVYLRIVMRWLTISLPSSKTPSDIPLENFQKKFRFDPKYGKDSFMNSLKNFHKNALKFWKLEPETGPLDTIKMALYITAVTMIEDLLESKNKETIPNLAKSMVEALSEFEEDDKCFSTRKAFITYVTVKVEREKLDVDTIEVLILFHQAGLALYDLSNFSDRSYVNRFLVVTKKSVNKWSNRATRLGKFSYKMSKESYRFLRDYSKISLKTFGVDKVCEGITEGRECISVKFKDIEDSEVLKSAMLVLSQYSKLVNDHGENIKKFVMENFNVCIDFVGSNKDLFVKFLEDKYEVLEDEYHLVEKLKKISKQAKFFANDVYDAGEELIKFTFENFIEYLKDNKKTLMELVVRIYNLEINLGEKKGSIKIKDINKEDVSSMMAYTLDIVEKKISMVKNLKTLCLFNDLCSYMVSIEDQKDQKNQKEEIVEGC